MRRNERSQLSKFDRAKRLVRDGVDAFEESDDELDGDSQSWQWIYGEATQGVDTQGKLKSSNSQQVIVGAQSGRFVCQIGDCMLLHAENHDEAWVGLICDFLEEDLDDGEGVQKCANFMWFSPEREVRQRPSKRTDAMPNEIYITPSWDVNPLASIKGRATVTSLDQFLHKYPSGKIAKTSAEHGKNFICRRGCNTRTARYTSEFSWEDLLSHDRDVFRLIALVKEQTAVQRKKRRRDHGDESASTSKASPPRPTPELRTPSKKQKYADVSSPASRVRTPSSRLITPSHKAITLKKPLSITPLSTRRLSITDTVTTPQQLARNTLHVSTIPDFLSCRDTEFTTVYSHLEHAISDGSGACIYISGIPGTGKTATVREVVRQLHRAVQAEELEDFIFVEINGMKVTEPTQSYAILWETLREQRVSANHALGLLEHEFSRPNPRRTPCVVLMDELDQLVTKTQSVVYNFFNWPHLRHSRLIVLAVANTMDLPERVLSNKISSRLGLTRITFQGYTHEQLGEIIKTRLEAIGSASNEVIDVDAIQFAARKVAAVSGDARRCLDICRRAVEIKEAENIEQLESELQSTPTKARPGQSNATKKKHNKMVTIPTIKAAIREATSNPLQTYLKALSSAAKIVLAAVLACSRRTGFHEFYLAELLAEMQKLLYLSSKSLPAYKSLLSLADKPFAPTMTPNQVPMTWETPRTRAFDLAIMELTESGVIGLEVGRSAGQRIGRVRLNIGDEEVRLAFQADPDVAGMGC